MKQSQDFLENAENCAQLAERAADEPTHNRYKRMEAAWRALAEEQDWLTGKCRPSASRPSFARHLVARVKPTRRAKCAPETGTRSPHFAALHAGYERRIFSAARR